MYLRSATLARAAFLSFFLLPDLHISMKQREKMLPLNSTTPGSDMKPCNVELYDCRGSSLAAAAAAGTTWEQICY